MTVAESVAVIRERIERAAQRSGRSSSAISLMAVSKFNGAGKVLEAVSSGVTLFGESRVIEASEKFPAILAAYPEVSLHLIGSLQRNKAKAAVSLFSCIQSVDRDELVAELAKRALAEGRRLDILLEYHCGEESKSGYPDLDALKRAADGVLASPSLRIRGLMTMAPFTTDDSIVRSAFRRLRSARDSLSALYPAEDWSVLSMGMSNDFEIAIEEGATLVRIGTAIFRGETL